jgi:hypothetical protein
LAAVIGLNVTGCKKDEETRSIKVGVISLTLKKNTGYNLGLGQFIFEGDKVEISKAPSHAAESSLFDSNRQKFYRYLPLPDFTGTDEAELKITSQGEVTYFPIKITVK